MVPNWAYKRALRGVRDTASSPNLVRLGGGTTRLSCKQIKERLLCSPCEQQLGRLDGYAASVTLQSDGSLPAISGKRPTALGLACRGKLNQFHSPDLDDRVLSQFALSVLWRAHVCSLLPELDLGELAEPIRAASLGESVNLPPLLVAAVVPPSDFPVDALFTMPSRNERSVAFLLLGLQFDLLLERTPLLETCCFRRTGAFFVLDGSHMKDQVLAWSELPTVGKVARR